MAAPAITDVTSAQIEVVEREMQLLFEESDQISAKVKKSEKVQQVSRYLYRIPFMYYRGGAFHKYSANSGSLGKGTGMKLGSLTAGYITSIRAYKVTREQQNTTSNRKLSTIDVLAETVAHAMDDSMIDDDIGFHGDGSGLLTNTSSAQTTTVLTFAGASDTLGVNRLREGMQVDVWKSDLTVNLSVAMDPVVITKIDYTAKTVTLSDAVTGANNQTNVLAFPGLESYGPAAPAYGQSTWPDKTVAGGIGGDSFRHGLQYINNTDSSLYYLGVQRSTVPQLMPAIVNASSSGITFDHGQLLIDQLIQRRSVTSGKNLTGIFHMAQRSAVQKLGVTISNVFIQANANNGGPSKDLQPTNNGYTDGFEFCGIPCVLSKRQDKSRADFVDFKKLFRAELHPIRFYEVDGRKFFEGRDTNGAVTADVNFHIEATYDHGSLDPGTGGVIHTLSVPTGY